MHTIVKMVVIGHQIVITENMCLLIDQVTAQKCENSQLPAVIAVCGAKVSSCDEV